MLGHKAFIFILATCLLSVVTSYHIQSDSLQNPIKRHHNKAVSQRTPWWKRRRGTAPPTKRQSSLPSGTGDATFYYDASGGGGPCGPTLGDSSYPENNHPTACEIAPGETLVQRGSNMPVAIPENILSNDKAALCGKELSVTWNGKTTGGFIVWDACSGCSTTDGVDFSSTMFAQLFGVENCGRLHGIQWEVLDNQIWQFPGGGSAVNTSSSSASNPAAPTTTLSAESTAGTTAETTVRIDDNCSPSTWQCAGNDIQQCEFNAQGTSWVWTTRVNCAIPPINCNTSVPVCTEFANNSSSVRL